MVNGLTPSEWRCYLLTRLIPGMRCRAPKRNFLVALLYVLLLFVSLSLVFGLY